MIIHKHNGVNKDMYTQVDSLQHIVRLNPTLHKILTRAKELNLADYYIGAGCITQTVWNYLSDYPLDYGISDIDFVYYDPNLDSVAEATVAQQVNDLFSDVGLPFDVKNEARVHLWYESRFGYPIEPYLSLEAAINTWPTTATSIGLRLDANDKLIVYAPFGLNDMFGKIVRANKAQITADIYHKKATKWSKRWPDLTIVPW